jgi:hypothetical protein
MKQAKTKKNSIIPNNNDSFKNNNNVETDT